MSGSVFAGMGDFADAFARTHQTERRIQAEEGERSIRRELMQEQLARQRKENKEADALKQDLKDAATTATVEQGAGGMIKPDTMDNSDVGSAETAALPNGGLMQGSYKVGGQSFTEQAQAEKAAAAHNSVEAVNQRTVDAYRKNGQAEKAIHMQNAVMDTKLKSLGLNEAEAKHADNEFNRNLIKQIDSNPDWTVGAAKALTDTNVGGLKGVTVTPRLSNGGKTVDFFAVGPDGKEHKVKSYANSADGRAEFLQTASRAPIETKIGYVVERARAEKDDQYKRATLGLHQSQENRQRELHAITMADAKVPAAVKLQAATLSKEMDGISTAMNKAMAEGTFDPNGDNAKRLIERQAALGIQYRQLLAPHMPKSDKAAPAADPLGFNKSAPAQPSAPAAAPAAAPTAAPAPAQQTPATAPTMQGVIDPLKGLSRQQIREKADQLSEERAKWASKVGAEKRVAEIDDLLNRIHSGMY